MCYDSLVEVIQLWEDRYGQWQTLLQEVVPTALGVEKNQSDLLGVVAELSIVHISINIDVVNGVSK